jgi:hypothetical protein
MISPDFRRFSLMSQNSDSYFHDRRVVFNLAVRATGVPVISAGRTEGYQNFDRIRWRAYELYVRNGYRSGHALDDWLAAEREEV